MPLKLLPAVAADAYRVAEIEHAAYAPAAFSRLMFPGPLPDNILELRGAELAAELEADATTRWWKVVDTDLGPEDHPRSLIAFAKWHLYEHGALPTKPRSFGPGTNPEACMALFGGIDEMRARLNRDRPFVRTFAPFHRPVARSLCGVWTKADGVAVLRLLHTDPEHQRRGAGRMLMQRLLEDSDRLKLLTFLESSPEGHALYLSCGFKDTEELNIDMARFGAEGVHTTYAMERAVPS